MFEYGHGKNEQQNKARRNASHYDVRSPHQVIYVTNIGKTPGPVNGNPRLKVNQGFCTFISRVVNVFIGIGYFNFDLNNFSVKTIALEPWKTLNSSSILNKNLALIFWKHNLKIQVDWVKVLLFLFLG